MQFSSNHNLIVIFLPFNNKDKDIDIQDGPIQVATDHLKLHASNSYILFDTFRGGVMLLFQIRVMAITCLLR